LTRLCVVLNIVSLMLEMILGNIELTFVYSYNLDVLTLFQFVLWNCLVKISRVFLCVYYITLLSLY